MSTLCHHPEMGSAFEYNKVHQVIYLYERLSFSSVEVQMFSAVANYSKCLNCTLGSHLQLMANIPCLLAPHLCLRPCHGL